VQRTRLGPAQAHEVRAHIAAIASRALRAVPGQDGDRVVKRVELANHIADAIAAVEPRQRTAADLVAASNNLLVARWPFQVIANRGGARDRL
jgi:hypothetical protein